MIDSVNLTLCFINRSVTTNYTNRVRLNKFDLPVADYIFCPWPKQP
jgi:hypothetical protein